MICDSNKNIVSIITPCFNSSKYLKDTINSVLSQTYSHWQWIIVDDKSTDNSIEIIKSFNDSRIVLVQLEMNSGAAVARNKALEFSSGRYITFLDSDDIWFEDFLEKSLFYMNLWKANLVFASYKRMNEDLSLEYPEFKVPIMVNYNRLLFNCPIPMLTAIYDVKEVGKVFIPTNVGKREDYAMWLDLLSKIDCAHGIQQPLAIYRIRK